MPHFICVVRDACTGIWSNENRKRAKHSTTNFFLLFSFPLFFFWGKKSQHSMSEDLVFILSYNQGNSRPPFLWPYQFFGLINLSSGWSIADRAYHSMSYNDVLLPGQVETRCVFFFSRSNFRNWTSRWQRLPERANCFLTEDTAPDTQVI